MTPTKPEPGAGHTSGLLPCPFCGGDGRVIPEVGNHFHPRLLYRPQCGKCGGNLGGFESRPQAIAAWNTRASAPALAAEVARLRVALTTLVDEFGGTLDQYHRNGPHFTHKDGTEVFDVAVILDRAEYIEAARAELAPDAADQEKPHD